MIQLLHVYSMEKDSILCWAMQRIKYLNFMLGRVAHKGLDFMLGCVVHLAVDLTRESEVPGSLY